VMDTLMTDCSCHFRVQESWTMTTNVNSSLNSCKRYYRAWGITTTLAVRWHGGMMCENGWGAPGWVGQEVTHLPAGLQSINTLAHRHNAYHYCVQREVCLPSYLVWGSTRQAAVNSRLCSRHTDWRHDIHHCAQQHLKGSNKLKEGPLRSPSKLQNSRKKSKYAWTTQHQPRESHPNSSHHGKANTR
jgi:hypothetical protein